MNRALRVSLGVVVLIAGLGWPFIWGPLEPDNEFFGGTRVLGYDPDPGRGRLVVNEQEAEQVREIFHLFVQHRSLRSTVDAIHQRGWKLKSWITNRGKPHEGGPIDCPALVRLIKNVLYRGDVAYKGKIYRGEQPVVFDDPFTSMDSFRRNHTVHQIYRCGEMCAQVVVLSHEAGFLHLQWERIPPGDRKALWMARVGEENTTIVEWDIERAVPCNPCPAICPV